MARPLWIEYPGAYYHVIHRGNAGEAAPCHSLMADLSGVKLGAYFGNISGAGVTVRYSHAVKAISRNRRLRGRISRIKKRIINI